MKITVYEKDIPDKVYDKIFEFGRVAVDTETTGLQWNKDKLVLCQLCYDGNVVIVRLDGVPKNLKALMEDEEVTKIFHYALFDLKFMYHNWDIRPKSIACTKMMAKMFWVSTPKYVALVKKFLGVELVKDHDIRVSGFEELTDEQKAYAAEDVYYLEKLYRKMMDKYEPECEIDFMYNFFDFIPYQLAADVRGFKDIWVY